MVDLFTVFSNFAVNEKNVNSFLFSAVMPSEFDPSSIFLREESPRIHRPKSFNT